MYLYNSFQTRFNVISIDYSYQLYARVGDIVNLLAMTVGALPEVSVTETWLFFRMSGPQCFEGAGYGI
jgi:hypothetical protein